MDESFYDLELLSQDEFNNIINLLLCHAFTKTHTSLISEIAVFVPDYQKIFENPFKQILIFLTLYKKWRLTGPFPEIKHYKFLHSLHDGVTGLMKTKKEHFKNFPKSDLIKIVTGLRNLLGKAVIVENRFAMQDKYVFIAKMFPVLPIKPGNQLYWSQYMQILDIGETNTTELKTISKINTISVRHLEERLCDLSREINRPEVEVNASFMSILNSFDQKLQEFMSHVELLIPPDFLENLTIIDSDNVKVVTETIKPDSDEQQLLELFQRVKNYYIQSQFWISFDANQ